eukprot:13816-Rhodomonas_salina.1
MEFDLIQSALFMVVFILGLIFLMMRVLWENRDLGIRLQNAALNEKEKASMMAVVQAAHLDEMKVWEEKNAAMKEAMEREKAVMKEAMEREKKASEAERNAWAAERSAWGEEKKRLEAAASEGAVVKADYESRLRSVSRILVGVGSVEEARKAETRVVKHETLFQDVFEKAFEVMDSRKEASGEECGSLESSGEESGSLDGSRCSSGSLAKGNGRTFVDLRKVADTAKAQAEEAEKELEKAEKELEKAEARVKELSEELEVAEKGEKAALAAAEAAEKREKAALAAKDAAEKRVETLERSIK